MTLKVYVAGPFQTAPAVREIHSHLWALDMDPVSSWAEAANGPESFADLSAEYIARIAECNDRDLRRADVILVVDVEGKGRETYAEMRIALEWGIPAIFVGRDCLTARRRGVVQSATVEEACARLVTMRNAHAAGYRGFALVTVAA